MHSPSARTLAGIGWAGTYMTGLKLADRDAAIYLPHMYGAVNYIVVQDVARLPVKVAEVYRRLTT